MNDYYDRLTQLLLDKNDFLTSAQARIWVELLWDDFENTSSQNGSFQSSELTQRVLKRWIEQYGEHLHEFVTENPKYQEYFTQDKYTIH